MNTTPTADPSTSSARPSVQDQGRSAGRSCRRSALLGLALTSVLGTAMITGCQKDRHVIERDPTADPLLAVRFNASDGQQVARSNIEHLASRPFFQAFEQANGRKPVVVVGWVTDEAYPAANTDFLINPIREFLINEGAANVIAERELRDAIRTERLDIEYTNPALIKQVRNEYAADFILFGKITSDVERATNRNSPTIESSTYLVDLRMVDTETLLIVWDNPSEVSMVRKDFGR